MHSVLDFCHDGEMPDAQVVSWINEKYNAIAPDLDERARRRWAGPQRLVHSAGVGLLQLRQRLEFQNARFDGVSLSLTTPMPLPRIDNGMSVREENLAKQNNPH